eukprot:10841554-Lingulodinium_polyedra.AAC.1
MKVRLSVAELHAQFNHRIFAQATDLVISLRPVFQFRYGRADCGVLPVRSSDFYRASRVEGCGGSTEGGDW